jgi:beta-glucuronidase
VLNDNRYDAQRVPLQHNFYDFYAYGGIYRSIELHIVPPVYFSKVHLIPGEVSTGKVVASMQIEGMNSGELTVSIFADEALVTQSVLSVVEGHASASFNVPNAQPWSAESPQLHTIRIETANDDFCSRIGFRTISTELGRILINGEPIKLLGFCRHEAHPQTGPAVPLSQHIQDLQILKDLGCNFIRGSHYPQDPAFLDLCDELGFYVFEETLAWGNRKQDFTNPAFYSGQLEQTRLMIDKSIHHPSVIMWGHLNEGSSNEDFAVPLYRELYQLCREMDPSRLVTYATMFPMDDLCLAFCDLVSVNIYPAWYAKDVDAVRPLDEINVRIDEILSHLKTVKHGDKPFIISEIGAGAIYGWRDPLNGHWTEDYQADYLETVCQRVVTDEQITGVSLWQYCDGRTYASSRALVRPRAFNNKGTLDEYRRPKMAYKTVKKIFNENSARLPAG